MKAKKIYLLQPRLQYFRGCWIRVLYRR